MLEKGLITYCAPTLAGLKSANLFNYRIQTSRKEILREVYEVNRKLNARGVRIEPLLWKDTFVLIYVYRPRLLTRDLHKEGVAQLLMEYGYEECNVDSCLVRLRSAGASRICNIVESAYISFLPLSGSNLMSHVPTSVAFRISAWVKSNNFSLPISSISFTHLQQENLLIIRLLVFFCNKFNIFL